MLEVKNVSYAYKTKKDKTILNNVSATFEEGIFYTIIGPSGAGKTTLLSLLAGLDTAVKGTVLCNGEDITKKGLNYHRKHNISLVFQNYNLIDYLTTVENVKLGGSGNAEKLLEEVGIGKEYWQRNVLQLSGGQQQRVAIARALASDAHVLLADEPTGNLDETTADEIIALLKKTAHELGKCVVVVTHSKHLAEEADEILEIKNGAISFSNSFVIFISLYSFQIPIYFYVFSLQNNPPEVWNSSQGFTLLLPSLKSMVSSSPRAPTAWPFSTVCPSDTASACRPYR